MDEDIAMARRFEFVEGDYDGPARAISCDGLVAGASLDLTHWQGNETPRRFKADTSTEIALNFVSSPEAALQWADAVVINNHFDTDGVLAAWALLEPERALANRSLLVAAAEAGDFDEWPALERGLWLDAAIRALGSSASDDSAAYRQVLPRLADLIRNLDGRRDLWGREWDDLQAAVVALESGRLIADRHDHIAIMIHQPAEPEAPGPLLARRFLPGARRYLLAFERENGHFAYRYERPRYSWADTVVRPRLAPPDAALLARTLGTEWTSDGLPGMTGIVQALKPVSDKPDAVCGKLASLDPA
jgi:hypothetical protein